MVLDELRDLYFKESDEIVKSIKDSVDLFFRGKNGSVLDDLINQTHTLSGNSLQMGFEDIADLSRGMLNFFLSVRDKGKNVSEESADVMMTAVENLKKAVESKKKGREYRVDRGIVDKVRNL